MANSPGKISRLWVAFKNHSLLDKTSFIIGIPASVIGLIGAYHYFTNHSIEVSGYVYTNRIDKKPVPALMKISNPVKVQQTTDTRENGKYSFEISETGIDSIFIIAHDKATGKETSRTILFSGNNRLDTVDFYFSDAPIKDLTDSTKNSTKINNKPVKNVAKGQTSLNPAQVVNPNEKADFAVMVTVNEKRNIAAASRVSDWLHPKGSVSQSILKNTFIEGNYFNEMFGGNTSLITQTNAASAVKYICLVKETIKYQNDTDNKLLSHAFCKYEVLIIEAATGKTISAFEWNDHYPGISEEKALQETEKAFYDFLYKQSLPI